jgi:hypothetical protein
MGCGLPKENDFPLLPQKQTLADFVAWCGDRLPDNCDELLARVTGW